MIRRIVIALYIVFFLAPAIVMVFLSFQHAYGILPRRLNIMRSTLKNYERILAGSAASKGYGEFFRATANSAILVPVVSIVATGIALMAGYGFGCCKQWPGREFLFWTVIGGQMIFRVALFVPLFVVVKTFGLTGLWAAGAPLLAWPVGTFLSRISAEAIPRSFLDEAQMDGASAWQLFRLVVAPMLKPVATFLLVTRAVDVLGDYGWQMVNLRSVAYKTLLVWLVEAKYMRMSDAMFLFNYGADAAAGILLLLPIVVVFYLGRKAMLGIDPIGKGLME